MQTCHRDGCEAPIPANRTKANISRFQKRFCSGLCFETFRARSRLTTAALRSEARGEDLVDVDQKSDALEQVEHALNEFRKLFTA